MSFLRTASVLGCAVACATSGCGSGSEARSTTNGATSSSSSGGAGGAGGATAGTSTGGGFTPGPHGPLPQVVNLGGTVLKKPKVQPLVYASDAQLSDITAFLSWFSTSAAWTEMTAEYGVGALTVLPPITLATPEPATLTDAELQALLGTSITAAADPGTIYLFALPSTTVLSDSNGTCCQGFDGYHSEAGVAGVTVAYALSCACTNDFDGPNVTDLQQRTVNMSHELVEAATDPFPKTDPAWAQEDDADLVWTITLGGEIADMCQFNSDQYAVPPGSSYMIQRSWSNAAAAKMQNPCVPVVSTGPYFNSVPVLADTLEIPNGNTSIATKGVKLGVGQTTIIPIQLFSDSATSGPWKVTVYDAEYVLSGTGGDLDLSLDKDTGSNGDTLHLTITAKAYNGSFGMVPGLTGAGFFIASDLGNAESITQGYVAPM